MLKYYQETNGDYLCVDTTRGLLGDPKLFVARTANISGDISSVCTTGIHQEYLEQNCRQVLKKDVPKKWLKTLC